MSASLDSLEIDRLSVPERLALIERIWESLAGTPSAELLSDAQKTEIERRLDRYADDPRAGSAWEEVKARLQARDRS